LVFVFNFFKSLVAGQKAPRNPWHANTLEWEAPTPPPHGNFPGELPTVYRGPYEYSSPLVSEDYLPQAQRLEPQVTASAAAHCSMAEPSPLPWPTTAVRQRMADYLALTKPRVVTMVLVTTLVGFYLGGDAAPSLRLLLQTLIGTALAAGGTLALNQYMERDLD